MHKVLPCTHKLLSTTQPNTIDTLHLQDAVQDVHFSSVVEKLSQTDRMSVLARSFAMRMLTLALFCLAAVCGASNASKEHPTCAHSFFCVTKQSWLICVVLYSKPVQASRVPSVLYRFEVFESGDCTAARMPALEHVRRVVAIIRAAKSCLTLCWVCSTTVFAAIAKGHGKGKLLSILGVQKIKKICTELEDSKSFQCKRVWGTGASGKVCFSRESFLSWQLVATAGIDKPENAV